MRFVLIVALLAVPAIARAQPAAPVPAPLDTLLAAELHARVQVDQAARELVQLRLRSGELPGAAEALLIATIDSLNTEWMKRLVSRRGWPGRSLVGQEGARNAWLLVQHADRDPAFQQEVLGLLEIAVAQGEASGADFAYLTDRVLTGKGEPQRFGTQLRRAGTGAMELFPLEEPDRVDERRASVGLPPLREYLEQVEGFFGGSD